MTKAKKPRPKAFPANHDQVEAAYPDSSYGHGKAPKPAPAPKRGSKQGKR